MNALAAALLLVPGLEYRQLDCTVAGHKLELSELQLGAGQGLELRAMPNPGSHPDSRCREGYGGPDLMTLLKDGKTPPDFEILAATNGTVFREAGHGYASNSLLWSKGVGLLAPLRRKGGTELFVADAQGGHGATLSFVTCAGKEPCAKLRVSGHAGQARAFRTAELISRLRFLFPSMTLAVQSNMPLMDSHKDSQGRFSHWSRCPDPNSGDWRCRELARTVLCSKSSGAISLLTTSAALPLELADGLRKGGACRTDCAFFYNLDGGGSTQLTRWDPSSNSEASPKVTLYVTAGRRIETTQQGCSAFRPVDNYLVIGRPKN